MFALNLLCVRLKIVGPENIIMCPTEGIFPKTPTPQAPGNSNQASYIGLRDPTPQEIPILSVGGGVSLIFSGTAHYANMHYPMVKKVIHKLSAISWWEGSKLNTPVHAIAFRAPCLNISCALILAMIAVLYCMWEASKLYSLF